MKYISKYTFNALIFTLLQFGCSSYIDKFGINKPIKIPYHSNNDHTYNKPENEIELPCTICYEAFTDNEHKPIIQLKCDLNRPDITHDFHKICIRNLVDSIGINNMKSVRCPMCRTTIPENICIRVLDDTVEENPLLDLFKAIKNKNTEQVQFIVNNNTSSSIFRQYNAFRLPSLYRSHRNPLNYAIYLNAIDIVKILLKSDWIEIKNEPDTEGNTPLHYATQFGREDIFKMLVKMNGIDLNLRNKYGETVLCKLVKTCRTNMVKILLKMNNIGLNEPDAEGNTPLHYAAKFGYETIVKILVKRHGIQLELRNKYGNTPLAFAIRQNIKNILDLLRK